MEKRINPDFIKADYFHRFLAKFIDFIICGFFLKIVYPVGVVAAITYILICDGLNRGASIGKQIIGLSVVNASTGDVCNFKQSCIRNAPFMVIFIFYLIPYIGLILSVMAGIIVLFFEGYFVISDLKGLRIGDHLAGTMVVEKISQ